MFMLSVKGNRAAELISPYTAAVFTNEGENATLSCNYSGSVRNLYCTVEIPEQEFPVVVSHNCTHFRETHTNTQISIRALRA
ncbi:hypothetical protein SRHO_G00020370 [Serrasalmus rhombeus]